MFTAALFTTAKILKEQKCPSTAEWIKKMWYIYTVEYYSAIKKNEILQFATIYMDLEGIMLCEISQKKKDRQLYFNKDVKKKERKRHTVCFHFLWNLKNKKYT